MRAYIMCGPIGSGKSYVADALYRHMPILNPDDHMPEGEEWTRKASNQAWDRIHRLIREYAGINIEFVIDSSQALRISRRRLTQYIRQVAPSYEIICVFVNAPFEECKKRNRLRRRTVSEKHLREYYDSVMKNPPSREDGYDKIVVVDNSPYPGNNDTLWKTSEPWPEEWYHV